jgi:hypothetical protein
MAVPDHGSNVCGSYPVASEMDCDTPKKGVAPTGNELMRAIPNLPLCGCLGTRPGRWHDSTPAGAKARSCCVRPARVRADGVVPTHGLCNGRTMNYCRKSLPTRRKSWFPRARALLESIKAKTSVSTVGVNLSLSSTGDEDESQRMMAQISSSAGPRLSILSTRSFVVFVYPKPATTIRNYHSFLEKQDALAVAQTFGAMCYHDNRWTRHD